MTIGESVQMIRSRLPGVQDVDINRLTSMLDGRPLAIEHSCLLLRRTRMPVADYCVALFRQPAHILKVAGDMHARTLTRVYELVVEHLAESPEATRALDYILFTAPGLLTEDMLSFLWVDSVVVTSSKMAAEALHSSNAHVVSLLDARRWPDATLLKPAQLVYVDPVTTADLNAGLGVLTDFGVIRSEDGRIVMHQLTRAILRELRHDQAADVHERVRNTVDELLGIDEWKPDNRSWATWCCGHPT